MKMLILLWVVLCSQDVYGQVQENKTKYNLSNDPKVVDDLATSKAWLNLLYYRKKGGHFESLAEKPQFFVDQKNGRTNPFEELKANVDLFQKHWPVDDNHPQCLFPARYQLLSRYFPLQQPVSCPKFEQWRKEYNPQELFLVYASQYISNPASVFGHSFLLIPSPKLTRGFWLTYNYSANIPTTTSGPAYVWGGLTGWFLGDFSVMPYYQRLFQYGSVENRDLWLYRVKLNRAEFDYFVRHLWELVHAADFRYYFLDENCAGVLMRTFAATIPELSDANHLSVYVHPVDIIKELERVGRLGEVEYVPSEFHVLNGTLSQLNRSEVHRFYQTLENPDQDISDVSSGVAETLLHYTSYMSHKNQGETPTQLKALERNAHLRRSQFRTPPLDVPLEGVRDQAPHLAHGSSAIDVGVGRVNSAGVANISYRFAIHELLDRQAGFLKSSAIEFMNLRLSATAQSVWVEQLTVASVETYQNFLRYDPRLSWRLQGLIKENLLTAEQTDQYMNVRMGAGIGTEIKHQTVYALVASDLNWGVNLPQDSIEVGPEVGAIVSIGSLRAVASLAAGRGLVSGDSRYFKRASAGISYPLNKNLSLVHKSEWTQLSARQELEGARFNLGFRYYF